MMDKFWKDKNVLITGADGFVGSHLSGLLKQKGANVIGMIRNFKPDSPLRLSGLDKKITVIKGSITDYETVEGAIHEQEVQACFHLAALATVPVANRAPRITFETNIKGTWNILEACRNSRVLEEIVIASSDKAYGIKDRLPYVETDPLTGIYPYDVSKSCADLIAKSYFHTYGLNVGIVRCANIYGGGDLHFSRVVPGTIRSLIFNETPLIRSDGTPKRDYIYIEDVVNAYTTLAVHLADKKVAGEAFNFSTNIPVSVLDLVNSIIEIFDSNIRPKILNEAKAEIPEQFLSSEKAQRLLGWKPQYELGGGLKKTVEWYKDYFNSR